MLTSLIVFHLFIIFMLVLDLGVFHKTDHKVSVKEALIWSAVWIFFALLFTVLIFFKWNLIAPGSALTSNDASVFFLTGYLIEKSLSVDNIFVFVLIFGAFRVDEKYQHRVLFWGVLGALFMRAAMIWAGTELIQRFVWIIYLFGAFLILTGIKMAFSRQEQSDPSKGFFVRQFKKFFRVTETFRGNHFFVKENSRWSATPLFLVLLVVEISDLIFAVDSIPAIFAVTTDPFIVYTSNVFAILGLRSLYFVLASAVHRFVYLKPALSFILVFVGTKMLLAHTSFKISPTISLAVIVTVLTAAIAASLYKTREVK